MGKRSTSKSPSSVPDLEYEITNEKLVPIRFMSPDRTKLDAVINNANLTARPTAANSIPGVTIAAASLAAVRAITHPKE